MYEVVYTPAAAHAEIFLVSPLPHFRQGVGPTSWSVGLLQPPVSTTITLLGLRLKKKKYLSLGQIVQLVKCLPWKDKYLGSDPQNSHKKSQLLHLSSQPWGGRGRRIPGGCRSRQIGDQQL